MKIIDKHNGYTLTRTTETGKWNIEGGNLYDAARLQINRTFNWETGTTTTEVFVNIVSTGPVEPAKAAEVAQEIMRATQTADYFTGVIAKLEAEQAA